MSELVALASQITVYHARNACMYVSFGRNECVLRTMRAGKEGFHEKEQSVVSLNLENLWGQIIMETEKVLVVCERGLGEVCKCLGMFVNI